MSERTEAPTPRRLQEARQEGHVPRSLELNAALVLLAGVLALQGPGARLLRDLENLMVSAAAGLPDLAGGPGALWPWLGRQVWPVLTGLGLVVGALSLAGVATSLAQTGPVLAFQRLRLDLSRVNPFLGLRRLFSLQGLVELVRALLKLAVVVAVAVSYLRGLSEQIPLLGLIGLRPGVTALADLAAGLAWRVGAAYLILAAADYGYQRWSYLRSMRMTREELKEELKRAEGDPFLRSRIREQQRRLARQRMLAEVPKADVVITNPVHLAVAVRYEAATMQAPKVLAKGAHRMAERIVAVAREHGVPILQNVALARSLYRGVDVGQEIPPDLYLAMAEVLAYVYSLRDRPQVVEVQATGGERR